MCASKFVNCEFSFTEALIKDPTVSSRHHPARVPLYITAPAPEGNNTFLFLEVHILSHPFISSRLTCGAETYHGYCYTSITISCITVVLNCFKPHTNITITTVTVIIAVTLIILLYIILILNSWCEKSTRLLEFGCCRLKACLWKCGTVALTSSGDRHLSTHIKHTQTLANIYSKRTHIIPMCSPHTLALPRRRGRQPLHHVLEMAPALTHSANWCLSRDRVQRHTCSPGLSKAWTHMYTGYLMYCTPSVYQLTFFFFFNDQGICFRNQVQGPYSSNFSELHCKNA